jgi:hypothetical protein
MPGNLAKVLYQVAYCFGMANQTSGDINSGEPPSSAARAATPDEVVARARGLGHRLRRHLDALEAGEAGAVDDVAAVLRTLLGHGRGNDVVVRVCRMKSIPLPHAYVSAPVVDRQAIGLAFGAVPTPDTAPEAEGHIWVDIDSWRKLPALIVRGAPRRVNTWEQLISSYANTYGSHVSGTIPHLLSETSAICYSGPLDLGEYLIHCAGIVAEDAIHQALTSIDSDGLVVRPRHRRLNPLLRLIVQPHPTEPTMTVQFSLEGRPLASTIPIAKVRLEDQYFLLELTPATTDTAHWEFQFTNTEPEWWRA